MKTNVIKSLVLVGMMSLSTVMYGSNNSRHEVTNNGNGHKMEVQMGNRMQDHQNDKCHKTMCKCQEQIQKHCHNKHCTCSCHKQQVNTKVQKQGQQTQNMGVRNQTVNNHNNRK